MRIFSHLKPCSKILEHATQWGKIPLTDVRGLDRSGRLSLIPTEFKAVSASVFIAPGTGPGTNRGIDLRFTVHSARSLALPAHLRIRAGQVRTCACHSARPLTDVRGLDRMRPLTDVRGLDRMRPLTDVRGLDMEGAISISPRWVDKLPPNVNKKLPESRHII
jgi:hypothetical protein